MRNDELTELKLLNQVSSDWDKAERIRKFLNSIESELANIEDNYKKEKILSWIKWARNKADWLDPLTEKEDKLLGKSKTIYESIINDFNDK